MYISHSTGKEGEIRVISVDDASQESTLSGTSASNGLAVRPYNNLLYYANTTNNSLHVYNLSSNYNSNLADGNGLTLDGPTDVAYDPGTLSIFVADSNNKRIIRIHTSTLWVFNEFLTGLPATPIAISIAGSPVLRTVSPSSGAVGTSLTLRGYNFTSSTVVKFGATAATDVNIDSNTQITVTVPDGASLGPKNITVTTGEGANSRSGLFTVTPPLTKTLTVSKKGQGSGTVTSATALPPRVLQSAKEEGINCGSTCSAEIIVNSVATLSATADSNSYFAGWDLCPGTGPCSVTMSEAKTVKAYFHPVSKSTPVANAGPDQKASVNTSVTISGANSRDKDGAIVSYAWTQESGASVALSNANTATTSFTPTSEGSYMFKLTVTDNDGLTDTDYVTVNVLDTKKPPLAKAGPRQSVTSGTITTLKGDGSFDRDGAIASYSWEQLTGDTQSLSSTTTANPTFTPTTDGVYVFLLTVTDNDGLTDSDVTLVNVSTNKPPFAVAYSYIPESGAAAIDVAWIAAVNTTVTLDGSNSVGRSGSAISSYQWEQIAGTPVTINDPTAALTSFTASSAGSYRFKLTVTDSNGLSATDDTQINVLDGNIAPTANAGADQNVGLNAAVTLDGSGSSDSDGAIATYSWEQLLGEPVSITNPDQATASFTSPSSASGLMFQLTVTDNQGAEAIDTVIVNATSGAPPVANADGNQNGDDITLDGCDSTGSDLSYAWWQTTGPNVTLNNPDTCSPSFTPSSDSSALSAAALLAKPMAGETYAFSLMVTDSDGLMSTSAASVTTSSVVSGSALNHIIYRNTNSGSFAFVKMNANGTIKNTTRNDGLGLISGWDALNTFSFKGVAANGAGNTQIIIANADGSRYGYLKLNSNGTLANLTVNDGVGWIHSSALNMSGWSMLGVQNNGSHAEGLNHLLFQNTASKDLGFMKLNSNGTIKNETGNDGFGRINFSINIHFDDTTGWRFVDIQENADSSGADRILLANAGTGMSAYLKLNSNGTLANATVNDGYGFLTQLPIADYHPVALDNLTNSGVVFKNPAGGTRAFVYVKLNANGTMENLTRGSGWDLMQSGFDLSGFDVFGFTTIGGENAMLLRSPSGGRVAWLKLNANGTAKNLTANNGAAWVSPDYSPLGWRAESMDPTSY